RIINATAKIANIEKSPALARQFALWVSVRRAAHSARRPDRCNSRRGATNVTSSLSPLDENDHDSCAWLYLLVERSIVDQQRDERYAKFASTVAEKPSHHRHLSGSCKESRRPLTIH